MKRIWPGRSNPPLNKFGPILLLSYSSSQNSKSTPIRLVAIMMTPPWLKAFRLNSVKTQSESFLCVCPSLFESHLRKDGLSTFGSSICHTHARWSAYTDRMPFFREVEGFHNWLFFAHLESMNKVTYIKHHYRVRPWHHRKGDMVSCILWEGDLGKRHIAFSSLLTSACRVTEISFSAYKSYKCREMLVAL